MDTQHFDAIIIGSGQAGTPLVFKMAGLGKKVAFIEKQHFGGTCLNVGCTPTKTYVASARRMFDATHGEALGIHIPAGATADMKKIKQRKDALIAASVNGIEGALKSNKNIHVFEGEARFTGQKNITVNGQILEAGQIFINVGTRARVPKGFENLDYLTNEEMLQLEEIPKHLIIVGGSYIGLEFGQIFRRLGSEVSIIEMGDRLISREDENVSEAVKNILEAEGIHIRLNARCLHGQQDEPGNITVNVDCQTEPSEINGSHLLLATGRIPNTDTLHLESTGIETNERGYIEVNDTLETNVPGIYALGDCNGKGAFTHTAYNDYEIVAANLFEGGNRKVSDRILTYALFIDPPLGRAGMTMKEVKAKDIKALYGYRDMSRIARAKEKGETQGFMSIIVEEESGKILGAAVLGIGGDEIISSILNIMYTGQSFTVIRDSVQAHPTVSELIPTMLEGLKPLD